MLDQYLTVIIIIMILSQMLLVLAYFPIFKLIRQLKSKDRHEEERAINQSEKILEEARQTASEEINSGVHFSDDLKNQYRETLEKLSGELLADFQKDFLLWGNESKESLKGITGKLEETSGQFLQDFKKELEEESRVSLQHVSSEVLSEVTAVREELNDYKKSYIKKLSQIADQIVRETIKESLDRTLSPIDQQLLVEEALGKIEFENGQQHS